MKTEEAKLPSGAVIRLRQITMKEENYLAGVASSRRALQTKVLVDVVSRCTDGFVETGPYAWAEVGGDVEWDRMLQGDSLAAMLALRKLSYREGANYDIEVRCPSCSNRFEWRVNLDEELVIKGLTEEGAEAIRTDTPLVAEIDGERVHYTLQHVRDMDQMDRLERRFPRRKMACLLRNRIKSVDGVDNKDLMNWIDGEGKGPYPGMTSDFAEDLRAEFSRHDCGVDTEIEVECPSPTCGEVFAMGLPFGGIFMPGRAAQQKRQRRLAGGEHQSED